MNKDYKNVKEKKAVNVKSRKLGGYEVRLLDTDENGNVKRTNPSYFFVTNSLFEAISYAINKLGIRSIYQE